MHLRPLVRARKGSMFALCLVFLGAAAVMSGCSTQTKEVVSDNVEVDKDGSNIAYPITIEHSLGTTVINEEVQRIAVFDLGILDALHTLGLSDRIVGIPKGKQVMQS